MWFIAEDPLPMAGLPVWAQVLLTVLGGGGLVKIIFDHVKARTEKADTTEAQRRIEDADERLKISKQKDEMIEQGKTDVARARVEIVEASARWMEDRKLLVDELRTKEQENRALMVENAVLKTRLDGHPRRDGD